MIPATFSIEQAAALAGASRSAAYDAARQRGALLGVPVARLGKRILIPARPYIAVLGLTEDEAERLLDATTSRVPA